MLYFAFGSNINAAQMLRRCPSSRVVVTARLDGWQLEFSGSSKSRGGRGTATIVRRRDSSVPGVVYRVSRADIESLDRYEGCPFVYQRVEVPVVAFDGETYLAQTYIKVSCSINEPSDGYFGVIHSGLESQGLPTGHLWEAYERSLAACRGVGEMYRVFVYGSLLEGLGNHRVLEMSGAVGGDPARTAEDQFVMVSLGSFPAVWRSTDKTQGSCVAGEVYTVDRNGLRSLDSLEGHPYFYRRELVDLDDGSQAWMYLLARPDEEKILAQPSCVVDPINGAVGWRDWPGRLQRRFRFDYR